MNDDGYPPVDEVRRQLLSAIGAYDRFDLWQRDGAPRRLVAAAERLKDATTDFRSALELQRELSADVPSGGETDSVVRPFGLLAADTLEHELPDPHVAGWAAWREVTAAAEAAAMASFVPPWPGQPEGWIESADRLLDAVNVLYMQEDRALRFAEAGHRPYLVDGLVPEGIDPDPPVPPTPGRRVREFQAEFGAQFAAGLRPLLDDLDPPPPPSVSELGTPLEQEPLPLGEASEPPSIAELRATFEQQLVPAATSAPAESTPAPAPTALRHRAPTRG